MPLAAVTQAARRRAAPLPPPRPGYPRQETTVTEGGEGSGGCCTRAQIRDIPNSISEAKNSLIWPQRAKYSTVYL